MIQNEEKFLFGFFRYNKYVLWNGTHGYHID